MFVVSAHYHIIIGWVFHNSKLIQTRVQTIQKMERNFCQYMCTWLRAQNRIRKEELSIARTP
jgi:hypothetical protein